MAKKFHIQVTILISCLLVLIVSCGSIIFYNYTKTTNAFFKAVEDEIQKATTHITYVTLEYLKPAMITSQFLGWFASKQETILEEPEELATQAMKILDLYPQISGFYNGDKLGNFLAIRRVEPGSFYPYTENRKLPSTAVYEIRTINRTSGIIREFHEFKDSQGQTVAVSERPLATDYFDPRFRPWYRGVEETKAPYWSDPYIFLISKQVGITAAVPVKKDNADLKIVISADITMTEVSKILAEQKIGKTGLTFILNQQGQVIGYPDQSKVSKSVNNQVILATYKDTENPLVIQAFNQYKKAGSLSFVMNYDHNNYIVRFKPFGEEFNKQWVIGFIVPEKELTSEIDQATQTMMFFSLVIVFISASLIFFMSKNISRPIEKAAEDMVAVGQFKINDLTLDESHFYEIQLMNQALQTMKRSLQDFSKFVPKAVVSKLIESGSGAQIGGKKSHITLMFTDIMGFTSISEKLSSEKLIKHLSDYLNELTVIIQDQQGTIDKYIGDAIMCFWGAPLPDEDHPINACRAALQCKIRLTELNKIWELDGKPPLYTRFGIHTGDAIVGNVGSKDRLNYSAFGDSVNLASRLEGINKYYGTSIAISHDTYKNVRHKFICRPLDIVTVLGKTEPMRIYELLFEISENSNTKLDQEEAQEIALLTERAFELYLARDWERALKAYNEILKSYPSDKIAPLFIKRCKEYKSSPPPKIWQGEYILGSK